LLSGPSTGAELLEARGGVMVLDAGDVVVAGSLRSSGAERAA